MVETSDRMSMRVRIRLSAMMFLQYMMFAVFWTQLAAYLTNMNVEGVYKATILSSMALGCLVAPIVCMFADRHFASQKVLMVMNFACAVLFFLAARQANPIMLFVMLLLAMFCYMPTWGLTNAIAMSNSPSEKFPQIRVFGSIGWVASGVFSYIAWNYFGEMKIDGTSIPLLCGAGTALATAIFNLTLPDTPPPAKGKESSIVDALGLRALTLMKNFNFAAFIILSMLVMIPFTMYFSYGSQFLQDQGFAKITITMNWGQFVEMFVMLLVPIALARFGVKWVMVIGLGALLARYVAFWGGSLYDQMLLYYLAILIHGVIFGFFFVGGQVYVDKKAPPEIKAQAQGLIVLICFGVGMLAGNFGNGALIDRNSAIAEPVAEGYRMPATVPSEMPTIPGAKVSEVALYGRALSDEEITVLNVRDILKDVDKAKRLEQAASEPVRLDEGLLGAGDALSAIVGRKPENALTISALVHLPESVDPNNLDSGTGTFFTMGIGENAMTLGLENDKLYWQAGDSKISQRVNMPRGEDDEGNPKAVHVVATFDGEAIKLYTGGTIYKRVDWNPIWMITTAISAVLLAAFLLLFRDDVSKPAATVGVPPAEEAGAEAVAAATGEPGGEEV